MVYKKRYDGRKFDEMRKMKMEVGVIDNADGSAVFQIGNTKVIAGVYGPKILHPQRLRQEGKGVLRVHYRMMPFSVSERKNPRPGRRDIELSKVIKESLESAIFLENFGGSVIDIHVYVVQGDAGTRCACVCAASLALADAGIPMNDLVAGVASGSVGEQVLLDLTYDEEHVENEDVTDMAIAYNENLDKVTLLQMDGNISEKNMVKALELGIKGCNIIKKEMQKVLKKRYE
ncbi:MAG: exosome complex exonuclease Rrp41 [Nanoarchaeota archaeon]|nr:exosome complex exonuclease Rrp41 [Nanoarchaeota archaeon]